MRPLAGVGIIEVEIKVDTIEVAHRRNSEREQPSFVALSHHNHPSI